METKVKLDHGRYLAMIELQKTEKLIRLPLHELIRVLFQQHLTIPYSPKTYHLAYRGNFSLYTVLKQHSKAAEVRK